MEYFSRNIKQADIRVSEAIEVLGSNSTQHFTDIIVTNAHETENISNLDSNKVKIHSVTIQSIQPLIFRFIVWSMDTFDDVNIDADSYVGDVELDMTMAPAFQIGAANQYYLAVDDLEINYEDEDSSFELHCSLQNLSVANKLAGAAGAVQLDVYYSPRL